jgi:hypothetical protein
MALCMGFIGAKKLPKDTPLIHEGRAAGTEWLEMHCRNNR